MSGQCDVGGVHDRHVRRDVARDRLEALGLGQASELDFEAGEGWVGVDGAGEVALFVRHRRDFRVHAADLRRNCRTNKTSRYIIAA